MPTIDPTTALRHELAAWRDRALLAESRLAVLEAETGRYRPEPCS
ncbi:hypothetical protein ACQ3I4_11230 [Zafaria sp. Z1313]